MAENKIKLSKSDRRSVMLRSQFLQGSWNYERMQNGGWAYSLIPALKKLYPNKDDASAALKRHLEFFNTHPYIAAPILGVTLALEEERANGAPVDDAAIQGVKVILVHSTSNFRSNCSITCNKWFSYCAVVLLHFLESNSYSIFMVYSRIWLSKRC